MSKTLFRQLLPGDRVEPLDMTDEFKNEYMERRCWYCKSDMKRNELPGDVRIASTPRKFLIQTLRFHSGKIVSDEFVSTIGESVIRKVFRLGKVLDTKGKRIDGFRTIYARKPVLMRNLKRRQGHICKFCGRLVLFAFPPALLRSQLASVGKINANESTWFVISDALWNRFPNSAKRNMRATPVRVIDGPADGYSADLDPWPNKRQKQAYLKAGGIEAYVSNSDQQLLKEDGELVPGEDFDAHDRAKYEEWLKSMDVTAN